jgi:hypothetical protein
VKCDFCSSPLVVVRYPAGSSRMTINADGAKGIGDSIGDWCACLDCARLIDMRDAEGLAKRSAAFYPDLGRAAGLSKDEAFLIVSMIQIEMFWAYLKGPGVRIGLN